MSSDTETFPKYACQFCGCERKLVETLIDDESLPGEDQLDLNELMRELKLAHGDTKYILFDEIQNLPKWELVE